MSVGLLYLLSYSNFNKEEKMDKTEASIILKEVVNSAIELTNLIKISDENRRLFIFDHIINMVKIDDIIRKAFNALSSTEINNIITSTIKKGEKK